MVPEVCRAIITEYQGIIKCPRRADEWRTVADRFEARWNFAHTIGALDGKHVRIKKLAKSDSIYYNYKQFFSIILLAMVDADYRFMYVECGELFC